MASRPGITAGRLPLIQQAQAGNPIPGTGSRHNSWNQGFSMIFLLKPHPHSLQTWRSRTQTIDQRNCELPRRKRREPPLVCCPVTEKNEEIGDRTKRLSHFLWRRWNRNENIPFESRSQVMSSWMATEARVSDPISTGIEKNIVGREEIELVNFTLNFEGSQIWMTGIPTKLRAKFTNSISSNWIEGSEIHWTPHLRQMSSVGRERGTENRSADFAGTTRSKRVTHPGTIPSI